MADGFFPEADASLPVWVRAMRGKRVAVLGHIRPDGDCIGSQVALTRILLQLGVKAVSCHADVIPSQLQGFVADTPLTGPDLDWESVDEVVVADCSSAERCGDLLVSHASKAAWCLDHHRSNAGFARHNWIEPDAAATAEMIAGLAFDQGWPIDAVTAQALYVGIATDTGQFRYEGTTSRVFAICARLVEAGAKVKDASHALYEQESEGRLRLLKAFLDTLTVSLDGQLAMGCITQSMLRQCNCTRSDTEGFVDYLRSIAGVRIAALLEEQPDGGSKGSLRSKWAKERVDLVAAYFGGGGHACAAGFSSEAAPVQLACELEASISRHFLSLE
jgi:phosphoesterase RecJ-like protein